ncbi:MAG: tetratricopeptide repeat protein [Litorivicinaceae bacterium]
MIWMGLLAATVLLGLLWALRGFGRQGAFISALVTIVALVGSTFVYWRLGAYEMSLSTEALNALPETERAYVIAQAAQDEFLARDRVADQEIINLFQLALDLDPDQVTALGSLGIIAFEASDYPQAVRLWTRMLARLPPGSEQAKAIETGIARATERAAQESAEKAGLSEAVIELSVSLSQAVPESLKDAKVFVFAREVSGTSRPLVAKRLSVRELPTTIRLSNQDALMGGRLHAGLVVEVAARLTVGDAAGTQGDWMGDPVVLSLGTENRAELKLKP